MCVQQKSLHENCLLIFFIANNTYIMYIDHVLNVLYGDKRYLNNSLVPTISPGFFSLSSSLQQPQVHSIVYSFISTFCHWELCINCKCKQSKNKLITVCTDLLFLTSSLTSSFKDFLVHFMSPN